MPVDEPDDEPSGNEEPSDADDVPADAVEVPVDEPDDEELDEVEPLEPAEPVVSANATAGLVAIAAPTPSATASAPTRPT